MRGRKPKAGAIRRGGIRPDPHHVDALPALGVAKPEHIAANPTMSACWDALVNGSPGYREQDVPLLEAYCLWYAVLRQSEAQVVTEDGEVVTLCGERAPDGQVIPETMRANPDIQTAAKASDMIRRLAAELQATPATRDRAGLMQAMTRSTQAEMVAKTLAGYREFRRLQDGRDAPARGN